MYPAIKQVTMYGAEKRPLARPRFWRLVMSPMRMVVSREIPVFPMVYRTSPKRRRQTQRQYIRVAVDAISELRTSHFALTPRDVLDRLGRSDHDVAEAVEQDGECDRPRTAGEIGDLLR